MNRTRSALAVIIPLAILALICGNHCTALGGHLEFALRWPGEVCISADGEVIE